MAKEKKPQPPLAELPSNGWVLKNALGAYVGREGMWTTDPFEAMRFFSEKDAAAYLDLHFREQHEVVEGA